MPVLAYPARLDRLAAHGIGLWDTVASAQRTGSLDTAMRAVAPAALAEFVITLPHLRAICFNGAAAAKIGRREFAGTAITLIDLPSSSPAYAAMPYSEKRKYWLILKDFLR